MIAKSVILVLILHAKSILTQQPSQLVPAVPWLGPLALNSSWPPQPSEDVGQGWNRNDLSVFVVYRKSNPADTSFASLKGIEAIVPDTEQLVSNVTLIFQCWSNVNITMLSYEKPRRVCTADGWSQEAILLDKAKITSQSNPVKFASFERQGLFALKDFRLRYVVENEKLNQVDDDLEDNSKSIDIDAYYGQSQALVDFEGIDPNLLKIITGFTLQAQINASGISQWMESANLSPFQYISYLPKGSDIIFEIISQDSIKQITFKVQSASSGRPVESFKVTINKDDADCEFVNWTSTIFPDPAICIGSSKNVQLAWNLQSFVFGLSISDIQIDSKIPTSEQIKFNWTFPSELDNELKHQLNSSDRIFSLDSFSPTSTSYIRLVEYVTSKEDRCYQLVKMRPATPSDQDDKFVLYLYLTMPDSEEGIELAKLLPHETSTEQLCLGDLFALTLNNWLLTIIVRGVVERDDYSFLLRTTDRLAVNSRPLGPDDDETQFFNKWLYFSSLHDYTITTQSGPIIEPRACDFSGHCFDYYRLPIPDANKLVNYVIPEDYAAILSKSTPYVRIQLKKNLPTKESQYELAYKNVNKRTQEAFDKAKLSMVVNCNSGDEIRAEIVEKGNVQVNMSVQEVTIKIPLHLIDLRIQRIRMSVSTSVDTNLVIKNIQLVDIERLGSEDLSEEWVQLIELDLPIVGEQSISSDLLMSVLPYQRQPFKEGSSIDVKLSVVGSSLATFQFNLQLENLKSSPVPNQIDLKDFLAQLKPNDISSSMGIFMPSGAFTFDYQKTSTDQPILKVLDDKVRRVVFLSPWLEAASQLSESIISLSLETINQPRVERVLIATKGFQSQGLVLKNRTDANAAWKVEDRFEKLYNVGGRYRVAYLIDLIDAIKSITVEDFNMSTERLNVCSGHEGPTYSQVDCTLEGFTCPWALYRHKDLNDRCLQTTIYYTVDSKCNLTSGCTNLLNRRMQTSLIYRNEPNSLALTYLPYEIDKTTSGSSYLPFARPKPVTTDDFCYRFKYRALTAPLVVAADGALDDQRAMVALNLDYPLTWSGEETNSTQVCASWLNPFPAKIDYITWQFLNKTDRPVLIGQNFVSDIQLEKNPPPGIDFIIDGLYANQLSSVQFFSLSDEWIIDTEGLTFRLELTSSRLLKWNADASHQIYRSAIRTRWLRVPPGTQNIRFFLNYERGSTTVDKTQLALFNFEVSLYNWKKGQVSRSNLTELINKKVNLLKVENNESFDYYQLELSLNFYLKLIPPEAIDNQTFILRLLRLSINDPCMDAEGNKENCGQGNCTQINGTNFECSCEIGYMGKRCDTKDYCELNNKIQPKLINQVYCQLAGYGECIYDQTLKTFRCTCPSSNLVWDILSERCIEPKVCPNNEVSELVIDKVSRNQTTNCICTGGYLPRGDSCVLIDGCNNEHRKQSRWLRVSCPPNSYCTVNQSLVLDANQYNCLCEEGYLKVGKECRHIDCDVKQKCSQKCHPFKSGFQCSCGQNYDLNGQECYPKTDRDDSACSAPGANEMISPFLNDQRVCDCRTGYQYEKSSQTCEINISYYTRLDPFGCGGNVIKQADGRAGCRCSIDETFNQTTRDCSAQKCSSVNQKECTQKRTTCQLYGGKPVCSCSKDEIKYTSIDKFIVEGGNVNGSYECLNKCELAQRFIGPCAVFETCHVEDVIFDRLVSSSETNEKLFVDGTSRVTSTRREFCHCEVGFEKREVNDQQLPKCIPIDSPTHQVEMNFKATEGVSFQLLFQRLLMWASQYDAAADVSRRQQQRDVPEVKCEKINEGKVSCSGTLRTKVDKTRLHELLEEGCALLDDQQKTCAYFLLDGVLSGEEHKLLLQPNVPAWLERNKKWGITISTQNYCSSPNRCNKITYSKAICLEHANSHLFDCLCDVPTFETVLTHTISIGGEKMHLSSCQAKDMCMIDEYSCKDHFANCYQNVTYVPTKNRYEAQTFCVCPSPNNYTLATKENSCEATCDGFCQNGACQVEGLTGNRTCLCQPGWYGQRCDQFDVHQAEKIARSFRVGIIVFATLTAVFAVVIVGLLIRIYFWKFR